ncbi:MAG: carbohydrate ABC transporter permease [Deinococcales bacterium]
MEHSLVERTTSRRKGKWRGEWLEMSLLLLPAAVLLGFFVVFPTIEALVLSFQREGLLGRNRVFVGFDNYLEIFRTSENMKSAWQSIYFALIVAPLEIVLAFAAALLIARPFPGVALYRTLFFLTTAVPTGVAAIAWNWFLNPQTGWANWLLGLVGIKPQPWLLDTNTALPTLAVITAWAGVGFAAILLTAGLQQIPEDLYEAARIDGANATQQFWNITIPMISPTLFLVTLLVFLRSLTAFGQIHLLTQGGPAGSSMVWIYRIYQDAFFNFRQSYAAAQSVLLFVVLLLLALLQFRLAGRKVHYE